MAYKYLTTARINSTIKKHNLEIVRGEGYHYFLDLTTGVQVGDSVPVAKLHHLSIDRWRDEAAEARATAPLTSTPNGATTVVAEKLREDAAKVRELIESLDESPVETWDDAVEATEQEHATA